MIVYRHALDNDGGVEFYGTKADAIAAFRETEKSGLRSRVEMLDLPTDKAGFVWTLNHVTMHPDHLPGDLIIRNTN